MSENQFWLTEAMFYVLLALGQGETNVEETAARIYRLSQGRVQPGPATLYTIVGRFTRTGCLEEHRREGAEPTYSRTGVGFLACQEELRRLKACVADAERAERKEISQ